jgi:hypothetical protein
VNGNFSIFLPITKVDEEKRLVYLRATQEIIDRSGEMIDYEASKPYFEKWSAEQYEASGGKSYGNVRAMHDPKSASGIVAEPLSFDDDQKAVDMVLYISDDQDWRKCVDGTYTGGSIGGSYGPTKVLKAEDGRSYKKYVAIPNHMAIVDRPCVSTATFQLVKADGTIEERQFKSLKGEVMQHSAATMIAICKAHGEEDGHLLLDLFSSEDLVKMDLPAQAAELAKIKARKDTKPEEGEKKYGDVSFADAKNKKYPIDTEEHIRAAWNYINKEKNAGKYDAGDLKTIKARIVSAWKEKIDKDGPPSAEAEKSAPGGEMKKVDGSAVVEKLRKCYGNYGINWQATQEVFDVQQALSALSQISALIQQERSEDHPEAAEQLASLTEALLALKDFISSEIQEVHGVGGESKPTITMNRVDGTGDLLKIEMPTEDGVLTWDYELNKIEGLPLSLLKIGAKHSKEDLAKIQAIHDHAAALGADCSTEKSSAGGDLIKRQAAPAETGPEGTGPDSGSDKRIDEALAKLDKAEGTISALEKRIKDIEDGPAEGKAFAKAVPVSKEQDGRLGKTDTGAPASEDDLAKLEAHDRRLVKEGGYSLDDLKKMNANQKAAALMKLIQAQATAVARPAGV